MQVSRGRSSLRKENAFSFAFEEKRCLGLSTRAPYANYDDDAKKEKKKKVRHPSFGPGDAPGPCSTPTRRRDTGSPRGPPPRSRAAGTPAIPCTSRRSRRRLFPRGSPRAGARVEASSPRRLSERTKMARVCRLRGDANVRGFASPRVPRRLRFRDPIRSPLRAKCRPRLDPGVSAGDSCGARRRRRLVARASVVSSVASGARNASPGGIRQSARGEFAREVRFMAYVLRSRRNANPTEG